MRRIRRFGEERGSKGIRPKGEPEVMAVPAAGFWRVLEGSASPQYPWTIGLFASAAVPALRGS